MAELQFLSSILEDYLHQNFHELHPPFQEQYCRNHGIFQYLYLQHLKNLNHVSTAIIMIEIIAVAFA